MDLAPLSALWNRSMYFTTRADLFPTYQAIAHSVLFRIYGPCVRLL